MHSRTATVRLAAAALAFGEYTRDWLPGSSPQWLGSGLLCGLALIHALRKKLGNTSIKNVRGVGWMVSKGS